jgi:uncharacterized damage-inducible protein DinB
MSANYLSYLVKFDAWANGEVLAFLAEHPELVHATAAGVFGTSLETMNHVVLAEASYLNRLSGGPSLVNPPDMPLEELTAFAREVARRAEAVALALPPPEQPLQRSHGKFAAETVFGQLIQHGMNTGHRYAPSSGRLASSRRT